jgi:hypothetical protein
MNRSAASKVMQVDSRRVSRAPLYALGVVVAVVVALLTGALTARPAQAEILTVNSTAHPGSGGCTFSECTLNEALAQANGNGQTDTINFGFGVSGEIQGGFSILSDTQALDVTINGPGARMLAVNGNNQTRPFTIAHGAHAIIKGLTIKNGKADTGGGIYNEDGSVLELDKVTVSGSSALSGGGIASLFDLTITNSTISGNSATLGGGGIYNDGSLDIENSTVSGNSVSGGGAFSIGGGIWNEQTTIMTNSTASGTLSRLRNSIVAGNTAPDGPDAKGNFDSEGGNIIGNTSGTGGFEATDLLNRNPLLGPLQNNGGPTNTRALWPGSPAVDRANNTLCPASDQRSVARKDGDGNGTVICDIGSYERSDFTSPKVSSTTPAAGDPGVSRGANLTATFSEKMTRSTINTATFKLLKVNTDGSTTPISSWSVSLSADGLKATLNPFGPFGTSPEVLDANTKYKAVVTTGARDLAGNQLDQSPTTGKQQKMWTFTTGSS